MHPELDRPLLPGVAPDRDVIRRSSHGEVTKSALLATPFVVGRHTGEAPEGRTAEDSERRVKVAVTGSDANYATLWCGPAIPHCRQGLDDVIRLACLRGRP